MSYLFATEVVLPIEHHLMGKPGTRLNEVEVVFSHPQALAQCRDYLERTFPEAEQMASLSTALAVADAQSCPVPAVAIATRRAAELNAVEIMASGIQDGAANATRFVVLGRSDHGVTGQDKTSICFSFAQDVPGQLYQVMGEFARRKINLAKIESRPTKQLLGEYVFWIDCAGHREDGPMRSALEAISGAVSSLRVLGSFPRWGPGD